MAVLHQVSAEEQGVITGHGAVQVEEELGTLPGVEIADGPAQKGHHSAPFGGDLGQVLVEVTDDQVYGQCFVLVAQ